MPEPRIATLTLNPAVDFACEAEKVEPTHKLRTTNERLDPGGGGINVARVVLALGGRALALFLAGGPTGQVLQDLLRESGVPHRAVPIRERTRISQTVLDRSSKQEYRFVAEGPRIREAEWRGLLDLLDGVDADWIVGSGSLPPGVPEDFYARVAQAAAKRGRHFVLDSSGAALRASLGQGVTLLKPSLSEFQSLVGRELPDPAEQEQAAVELVRSGATRLLALTLGGDGAVLATAEGAIRLPALPVEVRGTVGAGDSFVAGMTLALARGESPEEAFAWGVATGAAAVSRVGTAHPERTAVEALRRRIELPRR
ncbi:1-phosphofructokinase family hexose kinase [Roseomonas sp. BN140053]|uniref:1-phosphofructokinase family hexose kinase n=1 Tax=Roseomonas sp. BN140053 TaxID=3391898 RepID=UPI0039E948B0